MQCTHDLRARPPLIRPVGILGHLSDGILKVKTVPFVLNGKGACLLAVHQHGAKVDVVDGEDVIPACIHKHVGVLILT